MKPRLKKVSVTTRLFPSPSSFLLPNPTLLPSLLHPLYPSSLYLPFPLPSQLLTQFPLFPSPLPSLPSPFPSPIFPPFPSSLPSLSPSLFLPFPHIQLVGLGERCEFCQRGLRRSPSLNRIWCNLAVKSGIRWQITPNRTWWTCISRAVL